jgi:hypothetical protein
MRRVGVLSCLVLTAHEMMMMMMVVVVVVVMMMMMCWAGLG